MKKVGVALIVVSATLQAVFAQESLNTTYRSLVKKPTTFRMADGTDKRIEPKPLVVGSTLQINTGGDRAALLPIIEAEGTIGQMKDRWLNYVGDIKFSLKPEPASGQPEDVSQDIRNSAGTLAVNAGFDLNGFLYKPEDRDGPLGFDVRLGLNLAYQRAHSSLTNAVDGDLESSEFGVFAPECRVGVWLKYLLIGYKYSHAFTFGQESTLTKDVDHTGTSKLLMLAKIQPLSGGNSTDPFFLEFSYTGGKDSFNDGTFAITITKAFDTMW